MFKERMFNMKKARAVTELINIFDARPLSDHGKIDEFYVDTSAARGEDVASKIIYLLFNIDKENKKFLLMGHHGCGKSTELFKISDKLGNDYLVIHYSIGNYTELREANYIDIIFSMLYNVLHVIKEKKLKIDSRKIESIFRYWKDENVTVESDEEVYDYSAEGRIGVSIFEILSAKIGLFLQSSSRVKRDVTHRIEPTIPELIVKVNSLLDDCREALEHENRKLLFMIDDLDKVTPASGRNIFFDHGKHITSLHVDIIFTFPIYLYYSPEFQFISYEFDECILQSMIKVHTSTGVKFQLGFDTIRDIISKRADACLFADGVIDYVIEKSGGSLRSLFRFIREGALSSELASLKGGSSGSRIVSMENVFTAYRAYKSELERTIRKDQLPLLKEIYKNKRPVIDKENTLVMDLLSSLAVIEYNGERWCDLNPAVKDFLAEQGEINNNVV